MSSATTPGRAAAALGIAATIGLGLYSTWSYVWLTPRYKKLLELIEEYERKLLPPTNVVLDIKDEFVEELKAGLAKHLNGCLLMVPTHVTTLPDGSEQGCYYAIDLGGTNFRVIYVELGENHSEVAYSEMHKFNIPKEVYTGTGEQLFDFIATSVVKFMKNIEEKRRPQYPTSVPILGFCFSFVVDQSSLTSGKLLTWTKGFTCTGVVGNDPVQLLEEAFKRAEHPCHVAVLMNDTVGVLAAGRYYDPDTELGVIFGTGTNACTVECVRNIPKWQPDGVDLDTRTAINTEWGNFRSPSFLKHFQCDEDHELDQDSTSKGDYLFEKMNSGLWIGDVARRILLRLCHEGGLFNSQVPEALKTKDGFPTAYLTEIEEDNTWWLTRTRDLLVEKVGVAPENCSYQDRYLVRRVCSAIAHRSALVAALGCRAVLEQVGFVEDPRRFVIAVDGGLFENYKKYRIMLRQYMRQLWGADADRLDPLVHFKSIHDGSSFGAAVLAAAACRPTSADKAQG